MKKTILAVALLMTLIGVAGCGSVSTSGKQPSSETATAKQLFPHGITLLVGFPTGGAIDLGARLLQPYLQQSLGVPVVVQNMPGAAGDTAAAYEYRLKPDTPTFMMEMLPDTLLGQVLEGSNAVKFDVRKYTPLAGIFGNDVPVVLAKKGSPLKDLASLQNSKKTLTVGVNGIKKTTTWMTVPFLSVINHANIKAIPFTGGQAALQATVGGAVDLCVTSLSAAEPLIHAGKLQVVLEMGPKTLADLPGVESIAQVGKPDEGFFTDMGVVGPPNMPAAEAKALQDALAQAASSSELQARGKKADQLIAFQNATAWQTTTNQDFAMIDKYKAMLNAYK